MSIGDLAGRTVVVTGAGSGIGAATAATVLTQGGSVVAADLNRDGLNRIASTHRDRLVTVTADVASPAGIDETLTAAREAFGAVHGVVANAGITRAGTAEEIDIETWDEVQRANLRSVFLAARGALPLLRDVQGGSFVAVASQVGLVGMSRNVAYCAAKAGVVNLIRALAIDHGPEHIRFNAVCPGPIDTPMQDEGLRQSRSTRDQVIAKVPLGRLGSASEIAATIAFLLSPAAAYIHGAALVADGGWTSI